MILRFILAFAATLVATVAVAGPDRDLGVIVRSNIAVQSVERTPDYSDRPFPGTSGRRAADAVIRYQTDKIKPLLKTNGKTDVGAQGGSNDSSSSTAPLVTSGATQLMTGTPSPAGR